MSAKKPSRKDLLSFVETISRMTLEGEDSTGEGDAYHQEADDAIETLQDLIFKARSLLGQTSFCDDCGDEVLEIVGCPDSAEICQACFDAGRH